MGVCMCIYVHLCVHASISAHTYLCVYFMCMHMHTGTHMYLCVWFVHVCACM